MNLQAAVIFAIVYTKYISSIQGQFHYGRPYLSPFGFPQFHPGFRGNGPYSNISPYQDPFFGSGPPYHLHYRQQIPARHGINSSDRKAIDQRQENKTQSRKLQFSTGLSKRPETKHKGNDSKRNVSVTTTLSHGTFNRTRPLQGTVSKKRGGVSLVASNKRQPDNNIRNKAMHTQNVRQSKHVLKPVYTPQRRVNLDHRRPSNGHHPRHGTRNADIRSQHSNSRHISRIRSQRGQTQLRSVNRSPVNNSPKFKTSLNVHNTQSRVKPTPVQELNQIKRFSRRGERIAFTSGPSKSRNTNSVPKQNGSSVNLHRNTVDRKELGKSFNGLKRPRPSNQIKHIWNRKVNTGTKIGRTNSLHQTLPLRLNNLPDKRYINSARNVDASVPKRTITSHVGGRHFDVGIQRARDSSRRVQSSHTKQVFNRGFTGKLNGKRIPNTIGNLQKINGGQTSVNVKRNLRNITAHASSATNKINENRVSSQSTIRSKQRQANPILATIGTRISNGQMKQKRLPLGGSLNNGRITRVNGASEMANGLSKHNSNKRNIIGNDIARASMSASRKDRMPNVGNPQTAKIIKTNSVGGPAIRRVFVLRLGNGSGILPFNNGKIQVQRTMPRKYDTPNALAKPQYLITPVRSKRLNEAYQQKTYIRRLLPSKINRPVGNALFNGRPIHSLTLPFERLSLKYPSFLRAQREGKKTMFKYGKFKTDLESGRIKVKRPPGLSMLGKTKKNTNLNPDASVGTIIKSKSGKLPQTGTRKEENKTKLIEEIGNFIDLAERLNVDLSKLLEEEPTQKPK